MRKLIAIGLMVFWFASSAFAEKYYVYINKNDVAEKGQEAGQSEAGDIVAVTPYTLQYKPTPTELGRYYIVVMDLEENDIKNLLEEEKNEEIEINDEEHPQYKTIRFRKRKIDIDSFKALNINQEQDVTKVAINNILDTKPPLGE